MSSCSQIRPLSDHMLAHQQLLELFEQHQCALISLEIERACELLADFTRHLRMHRDGEEEFVLPVYGALDLKLEGGPVEFFQSEHEKLGWWLGEMRGEVNELLEEGRGRGLEPRDVLPLLDRQATFKHLLDHHDKREANILYPAMDRELNAKQVGAIWLQLDGHEAAVRASWS
ncbi:MAG: hypothetical protein CMJ87_07035 [Planctomycetes bacterium]|nr:hypothetical protein [Planctomycetota bacterium]